MHPRIVAERRVNAESRLSAALGVLADRGGVTAGYAPMETRDRELRSLYALESMAEVAEQLAGTAALSGTPTDPAATLTADDLIAARVREAVPRLNDDGVAGVLAEVKRETDDNDPPLHERLVGLPGIGDVSADRIIAAIADVGLPGAED